MSEAESSDLIKRRGGGLDTEKIERDHNHVTIRVKLRSVAKNMKYGTGPSTSVVRGEISLQTIGRPTDRSAENENS